MTVEKGRSREAPSSPSVAFIAQTLRDRIAVRQYRDGHWLPTERSLALEFVVSRATIRQALDALEAQGLLSRANGCRPVVRVEGHRQEPDGKPRSQNLCLWMVGNP